jgi:hypothetical protein
MTDVTGRPPSTGRDDPRPGTTQTIPDDERLHRPGDVPTGVGPAGATTVVRERELAPEVLTAPSDRVRWGPIWAGVVVVVAVFALLQLALFATDAISLDINPTDSEESLSLWTGLAAIVAFLVGGMVAGATAKWRSLNDGLIQGIVMWSVAVLALLLASSVAFGSLTASLGGVLGDLASLRDALTAGESPDSAAVDDARSVAADACLFLGVTVAASAVGALIGAKLWPRRDDMERRRI